jgi:membrane-bound metal-dependent hydrolase YbcI (DUF457 family)
LKTHIRYRWEVTLPQSGIHSLVGLALRRAVPKAEWLVFGLMVGSVFPDVDFLVVVYATFAMYPLTGLHRTFTHSLFTVVGILVIFCLVAALTKKRRWFNFGIGMGLGVLIHILLDLLFWFNGEALLWPLPLQVNFWSGYTPPSWASYLVQTGEYLCFGLYFAGLYFLARRQKTDTEMLPWLEALVGIETVLWVALTVLVFLTNGAFAFILRLIYLLCLALTLGLTIRMRATLEFKSG